MVVGTPGCGPTGHYPALKVLFGTVLFGTKVGTTRVGTTIRDYWGDLVDKGTRNKGTRVRPGNYLSKGKGKGGIYPPKVERLLFSFGNYLFKGKTKP